MAVVASTHAAAEPQVLWLGGECNGLVDVDCDDYTCDWYTDECWVDRHCRVWHPYLDSTLTSFLRPLGRYGYCEDDPYAGS